MTTQLHLARVLVDGRAHSDRDLATLRNVELVMEQERRTRRHRRFRGR